MFQSSRELPDTSILNEVLPEWDFGERHRTRVAASPQRTMQALKEVTPGNLAPIFQLLFEIRRIPNRLIRMETEGFDMDVPLMHQFLTEGPVRFVMLGCTDNELCFGSTVSSNIIEVWNSESQKPRNIASKEEYALFHDSASLKVAAHFTVSTDGRHTVLEAETRVRAMDPKVVVKFAPYWYAIRIGGGIVRRALLEGVRKKAES